MSDEAFQDFIDTFTALITQHLSEGGVLFSCIDWRSHDKIVLEGERAGLKHMTTVVWDKGSGGMGGLYRSAHELIPVFCRGKAPTTNNVELGRHGRDRTNVWSYPGANRPGSSAAKALKHHPTPKPVGAANLERHSVCFSPVAAAVYPSRVTGELSRFSLALPLPIGVFERLN